MTATRETLREAVARAIRDLTFSALTMDETRDVADAALAAIEAAGWRIVPEEPNGEMVEAGARRVSYESPQMARNCYESMLSAAPRIAEKE